MFAVKTRASLRRRWTEAEHDRGGEERGEPPGILYTEHASIHRVTFRFVRADQARPENASKFFYALLLLQRSTTTTTTVLLLQEKSLQTSSMLRA